MRIPFVLCCATLALHGAWAGPASAQSAPTDPQPPAPSPPAGDVPPTEPSAATSSPLVDPGEDEPAPPPAPPATASPPAPPPEAPALAAAPVAEAPPEPAPTTVPRDDGHDWVGLKNGEWLQGEFLGMRDGDLEFDSDEFEEQTLDWDDVAELHVRRPTIFVLDDLTSVSGTGYVTVEDGLVVQTDEGEQRAPYSKVLSIVSGSESEIDYWSLDLDFGLSVTSGNTNQSTLNASSALKREAELTRFAATYNFNLGFARTDPSADADETVNNHRALTKLDVFVWRAFYVTPAFASLVNDRFRNLDLQVVPGSGVGIHVLDNKIVLWDFELGGSYVYTNYASVQPGQAEEEHDGALQLATKAEIDITKNVDLDMDWTTLLVLSRLGRTRHHAEAKLEVDITDVFDINLRAIFDRIEEPVTDENGITPVQNDIQLIAALGIDLG